MTDTLTSERGSGQVRRLANERLPGALLSLYAQHTGSTTVFRNPVQAQPPVSYVYHQTPRDILKSPVEHFVVFEAEGTPSESQDWDVQCHERIEFQGLAAVLVALQEPARNNWGTLSLVLDEDLPLPTTSDSFISHLRQAFVSTWVDWRLGAWVEHSAELARECMSAVVEEPRKVVDPENGTEWWIAVPIGCHGEVATIVEAYGRLAKRFVAEVPPEARDRIRFELRIEE